jgi:hypothetical protein
MLLALSHEEIQSTAKSGQARYEAAKKFRGHEDERVAASLREMSVFDL